MLATRAWILIVATCAWLLFPDGAIAQTARGASPPAVNLSAPGEAPAKGPPLPPPRDANGRVRLTAAPGATGIWMPIFGFGAHLTPPAEVPFQPWAKQMYEERLATQLEPHARCKASGGVRQIQTPYGVEIVELPELQRIYIFDIGGPHTWRTVYMDGRPHPLKPQRSAYGHSIGWWEDNDTLLVDTVGYNEAFWVDRRGLAGTGALHTLERFRRRVLDTIEYEILIDDPGAYTRPFTGRFEMRLDPRMELYEYVCQEANYATELMVHDPSGAGLQSDIVP
jgi:hypothetical protein